MRIRAWFDGFSNIHSRVQHGNGFWDKRDVTSSPIDAGTREASRSNRAGILLFPSQSGRPRSAANLNYHPLSGVCRTLGFPPPAERRGLERRRRSCADVRGAPCPTLTPAFGTTTDPISIEALSAAFSANGTRTLLLRVAVRVQPCRHGTVSEEDAGTTRASESEGGDGQQLSRRKLVRL